MTRIGAAEGDIVNIIGKRRSVAKCMPFRERDIKTDRQESESFVRLTNVVRNNAEVPLGGNVSISRATNVVEAKQITVIPCGENEIIQHYKDSGVIQSLSPMLAGTPALTGDYIISMGIMGPWHVFEVTKIEPVPDDSEPLATGALKDAPSEYEAAALITKSTAVLLADREVSPPGTRGYPVFWIVVTDNLKKLDSDVFLVMTFTSLHSEGLITGQIEKKIERNSDIQDLVRQYNSSANEIVDNINEEARVSARHSADLKNRILQKWMGI